MVFTPIDDFALVQIIVNMSINYITTQLFLNPMFLLIYTYKIFLGPFLMKFSTDNYRLQTIQNFPFTKHIDTKNPIYALKKTKHALLFTNSIDITISNEKTKQMHFDNNTCCIQTNDKLIIAGDENGQIKVFDYKKRKINTLEYNYKVNGIEILKDRFVAVGNSTDVVSYEYFNKDVTVLYKHDDFVTCCDHRNELLVTGSIDKSVIFYDTSNNTVKSKMTFANSISKVQFVSDTHILVVARYQMFLVCIETEEIVKECYIHTKETTGLVLYNDRIYTSSMDGNLKSWTSDLKQLSQIKFDDKVLSFDICDDDIYVGLDNGTIYKLDKEEPVEAEEEEIIVKQKKRYYRDDDDTNIKRVKVVRKRQTEIEKLMNNNQHWLAFSKIFCEPDIDIIYAVLHHIKDLKGLKKMMLDRNEEELIGLFDFMIDSFRYVEMRGLFVELMVICSSLYEDTILDNEELIEKINHFHDLLAQECDFQAKAIELTGYIECALIDK